MKIERKEIKTTRVYDDMQMVGVSQVRQIIRGVQFERDGIRRYWLRDVSGIGSFGYTFSLVEQIKIPDDVTDENGNFLHREWVWCDVCTIAMSESTYHPYARNMIGRIGAYGPTFDRAAISEVLGLGA